MKVFAENRKARNSYEFLEFIESGIVLSGSETKSVRNGGASLIDAFAIIEDEEIWIRELNIERSKRDNVLDFQKGVILLNLVSLVCKLYLEA